MPAQIAQNAALREEIAKASENTASEKLSASPTRRAQERSRADIPVETVRVLNPYARPLEEESPARSRAGMLAAWLRDGGDRSELPPLPREDDAGAATEASVVVDRQALENADLPLPARQLALRLQLLSGEIVEQNYGPTRRWAILDAEGDMLEAPSRGDVEALIDAGRIALSHFERGAAVWRLQPTATEGRAAYCDAPRAQRKRAS